MVRSSGADVSDAAEGVHDHDHRHDSGRPQTPVARAHATATHRQRRVSLTAPPSSPPRSLSASLSSSSSSLLSSTSSCSSSSSSTLLQPRGAQARRARRVVHYATHRGSLVCCSRTRSADEWVQLNVGGRVFTTTVSTLCADANSLLARMCMTLRRRRAAEQRRRRRQQRQQQGDAKTADGDDVLTQWQHQQQQQRARRVDPCDTVAAAAYAAHDSHDEADAARAHNNVTPAATAATVAASSPRDDGEERDEEGGGDAATATSAAAPPAPSTSTTTTTTTTRRTQPHNGLDKDGRHARSRGDAGGEVPTCVSRRSTRGDAVAATATAAAAATAAATAAGGAAVTGDVPLDTDAHNSLLLDLDPDYFAPVLNYLRHGTLMLPPALSPAGVRAVAEYLHVRGLVRLLTPPSRPRARRQLLFSWGVGSSGELGTQQFGDCAVPTLVRVTPFAERVVRLAVGANYTCALTRTGHVYTFGNGDWGQLGLGSYRSLDVHPGDRSAVASVPRRIPLFERHRVRAVSAGYAFVMAIARDGAVYCWGNNNHGQSGLGKAFFDYDHKRMDSPQRMDALAGKRICKVSCGSFFSLALSDRGELYSWGLIECLGLGSPEEVRRRHAGSDALALSLSNERRAVLLLPQRVHVPAPHGNSNSNNSSAHTADTSAADEVAFVHIHAGQWHSGALTAAGELYTWGVGYQGRLGHGTKEHAYVPTRVRGALASERVVDVACGSFHTVALTARGAVYCWGDNASGQCGTSAALMEAVTSPCRVVGLELVAGGVVRAVGCGRQHTVVVVAGPQPGCVCACCRLDDRGKVCGEHAQVYTFGEGARVGASSSNSNSNNNNSNNNNSNSGTHTNAAATATAAAATAGAATSSARTGSGGAQHGSHGGVSTSNSSNTSTSHTVAAAHTALASSAPSTQHISSTANAATAAAAAMLHARAMLQAQYAAAAAAAHMTAPPSLSQSSALLTPPHLPHPSSTPQQQQPPYAHGYHYGHLPAPLSTALSGGVYDGVSEYVLPHALAADAHVTGDVLDGGGAPSSLWPSSHAALAAAAAVPAHVYSTPFQHVPGMEAYHVTGIASGPYHTFAFAEELQPHGRRRAATSSAAATAKAHMYSDDDDDDDDTSDSRDGGDVDSDASSACAPMDSMRASPQTTRRWRGMAASATTARARGVCEGEHTRYAATRQLAHAVTDSEHSNSNDDDNDVDAAIAAAAVRASRP